MTTMQTESQDNNVFITSSAKVDYDALAPEQQIGIDSEVDTPVEDVQAPESEELSEEDELLKLLSEDDTEETETEEPEEPEEDDKDFEVKFEQHFEKTFGMKPDEAVTLVQELVQERIDREVRGQLTELQQAWGTDELETQQRLEAVREVYNSLTPEKQQRFNNVKGAQTIWKRLEATGKAPKVLRGKTVTPTKSKPQPMYTQKQIDAMPIKEYEQHAQRIAYAYANGLVTKG